MFWFAAAASAFEPTPEQLAFRGAVVSMVAAMDGASTATFVLHQQEYVNGSLQPVVTMTVKYRKPNDVVVDWSNGQKVVWLPGQNDDRMYVDPGPLIPNLSLSPENGLAKRGQRHTIRRLGLAPVAGLFASDLRRIEADPERLAPQSVTTRSLTKYGRTATCYSAEMRKDLDPKLYAAKVEVCLDDRSLPVQLTMWDVEDGELRVIEQYGYEALNLAPGLPANAFDPAANGF